MAIRKETKTTAKTTAKKTAAKPAAKAGPKRHLVIVESPSKARTIGKYLGARYNVIASNGHVIDLPKSRMGIDFDHDFAPEYINVRGMGDKIKEIRKAAQEADVVYLATDPDREGEAISWHIARLLNIDPKAAKRVEFHEITKDGVKTGIAAPRAINTALFDAQQGRRVMDRIVGYKISPVLWAKVQRGLSAGRVQSAALRIICDREKEIEAFVPQEYWVISADLARAGSRAKKDCFTARLEKKNGRKLEVRDGETARGIVEALRRETFAVAQVENKQRSKKPWAPYTTSTLQQDASVRLNFGPQRTMRVAQHLYESGRISYHRTDSVRISAEADAAAKAYIAAEFGRNYVGSNVFTNRNRSAQDAHEAIRPTNVTFTPQQAEDALSGDDLKLYKLIWSRFVASRMQPAVYDTQSAEIAAGAYCLRASGSSLAFDGYLRVYTENDESEKKLPKLEEGETLDLLKADGEQKFTEPPARFTEASLIKELEADGIGRPSTYAPIVTTLTERKYVKKERKSLVPTQLGEKVIYEIMVPYFKEVVDTEFTAKMEADLDEVEAGKREWTKVVGDYYYGYLKDEIDTAMKAIEHVSLEPELTGELCPQCGKPLARKRSRYGEFIGCTGYPECRFIKPIVKGTGVMCPRCGKEIVARRSRKGKTFYGCSGFPACDQVYWDKPVNEACPKCGSLLVSKGRKLRCSNAECGYVKE